METSTLDKAHCNTCAGIRDHHLLRHYHEDWSERLDEYSSLSGKNFYEILKCAGCGLVCMRHTSYFSEHTDDDGRAVPQIYYYPPSILRRKPNWAEGAANLSTHGDIHIIWMPDFVTRLLNEIYVSLHNGCRSVAAMGIRALLESVMIDKVGDNGTFSANLDALEAAGYVARIQKEILKVSLDVGSAAIHRGYHPTLDDLKHTLDITEILIETLYVSPAQAEQLRKRTPARPVRL